MRFFPVLLVSLVLISTQAACSDTQRMNLSISGYTVTVEVAHTQLSRAEGLMYRKSLAADAGMLFVFPSADYYSMWMKNTYIPLSVAFIDERGVILNIADMHPESLKAHDSAGAAKYALEVNRGWFLARRISAGMSVLGLENAPAAEN